MKEIRNEIIKKEYTYKYESFDGIQFDTKEECEEYEHSAEGVLKFKLQDLVVCKQDAWALMRGYEDNDVLGLKLTKEKDKDTVLQLYLLQNPHYTRDDLKEIYSEQLKECETYINEAFENNDLLLMGVNCDGYYYFIGTRNMIVEKLRNFGETEKTA